MEIACYMNNPKSKQERGLIKGALRRVFSRSDLRKSVIEKSIIKGYKDPKRKAVKFWVKCAECGKLEAKSNVQVDHKAPVIKVTESLDDLTWDQLVDRIWCDEKNLSVVCKPCHQTKTKAENKERRAFKKGIK